MNLIIGGYAQGKLEYVLSGMDQEKKQDVLILDETNVNKTRFPDDLTGRKHLIINHLHLIIRETADLEVAADRIRNLLHFCSETGTELTVICDELGCGVIPLDQKDRIYRENVGRILCILASEADSVERIICGISCKLK